MKTEQIKTWALIWFLAAGGLWFTVQAWPSVAAGIRWLDWVSFQYVIRPVIGG